MHFVDLDTSRRVQDAALLLLDACREAAKKSPAYKPSKNNIDDVVSIAVQSLLMSDHWNGGEDRKANIDSEEAVLRIKGMSEGLGMSIGSLPTLACLTTLAVALPSVKSTAIERAVLRGRETDSSRGGK